MVRKIVWAGLLTTLYCLVTTNLQAQSVLYGQIIDRTTGEPLIGAQVYLQEAGTGSVTDLDGNYHIQLETVEGPYTVTFQYIGYQTKKIDNYDLPDFAIEELNAALSPDDEILEEVVIEERVINDNEFAMLRLQKNANAVQDGISSKEIQRLGATNAAESMKQVVGATVEDDKYVVMRGLGDRYSTTQLNGMQMVSTDPYRNSSAMDLVPTNMVDNIITLKTFTPDQPGNFTGGSVNISTKAIPNQFYSSVNFSMNYNPVSSFNDEFLVDPAGEGVDGYFFPNQVRELPSFWEEVSTEDNALNIFENLSDLETSIANNRNIELIDNSAEEFKTSFQPLQSTSFMDWSAGISTGNRLNLSEKSVIGYNAGISLQQNYRNFQDYELNAFKFSSGNDPELQAVSAFDGNRFNASKSISIFGSAAWQYKKNTEVEFKLIVNNDVDESVYDVSGIWPDALSNLPGLRFFTSSISFQERQQNVGQISFEHVFNNFYNSKLSGTLSGTLSSLDQPDMRLLAYTNDENSSFQVRSTAYDEPFRFYRNLKDSALDAKIDFEIPIGAQNKGNKIKTGIFYHAQNRGFEEFRYQIAPPTNTSNPNDNYLTLEEVNGDLDSWLADDNLGVGQSETGDPIALNLYYDQSRQENIYFGEERFYAAYGMGTYNLNKFKFIGGLRMEYTLMETVNLIGSKGRLERTDLLPSLNVVYELTKKANLRAGINRTIARPNLREMSTMSNIDLIGAFIYTGNPDLTSTQIMNYDLRYEYYPNPGEIISVSPFAKTFNNPIVQEIQVVSSQQEVKPVNAPDAYLFGVEFEVKKRFGTFTNAAFIRNLGVRSNLSLIYSEIQKTQQEIDQNRNLQADLPDTRTFQAQSPYIFNFALNYLNDSIGLDVTLSANFWGERLVQNGIVGTPDVFEVQTSSKDNIPLIATPTVNLVIEKQVVKGLDISLYLRNLTNPYYTRYSEWKDTIYVFESYRLGARYGFKLKYTFN